MPPRRIPIGTQRQTGQRNSSAPWQSSLDIVFSFSRSQAYFGSSLPTAPSFVDEGRYLRSQRSGGLETDTNTQTADSVNAYSSDSDGSFWTEDEDEESSRRGVSTKRQFPRNARSRSTSNGSLSGLNDTMSERTALLSSGHGLQDPPNESLISVAGRASAALSSEEQWKEAITQGKSTYGQTLFNTINILVGVGLLAEPLAFAYAGWILGTIILLFCAVVTNYTAKMLARLMAQDKSLQNYSDVLIKAYNSKGKTAIYSLFILEISALSVALFILFSDSMAELIPAHSPTFYKIVGFFVILPTTYIPLRYLSLTSIVGILSSIMLFVVVLTDGLIKNDAPGSLWVPAKTSWGPDWAKLPLSFGLFMSGFAGHAVIPSLYKDMQEPQHFESMINVAYIVAFILSWLMGAAGYIMFGNTVSNEITKDLNGGHGYPVWLNTLALWMIAVNPIVKYALALGPLINTMEHLLNPSKLQNTSAQERANETAISLASSIPLPSESFHDNTNYTQHIIRPLLTGFLLFLAIMIPNFGIILSFLGSSSAFAICVIGPVIAYLVLGRKAQESGVFRRSKRTPGWSGLSKWEVPLCWVILSLSIGMAGWGTSSTFLEAVHGS